MQCTVWDCLQIAFFHTLNTYFSTIFITSCYVIFSSSMVQAMDIFMITITRRNKTERKLLNLKNWPIVTLSGDQNEVFESLVDFQRLEFQVPPQRAQKEFFRLSTFDFYGLIKSGGTLNIFHFGEWRKFHHINRD